MTASNAVSLLVVGTAIGYVIASIVFAISAVSIPLLLDRDVPVLVAIATSVVAVRKNWLVMLDWAATIVLLVGVGLAAFFAGLAITLPLVAGTLTGASSNNIETSTASMALVPVDLANSIVKDTFVILRPIFQMVARLLAKDLEIMHETRVGRDDRQQRAMWHVFQ